MTNASKKYRILPVLITLQLGFLQTTLLRWSKFSRGLVLSHLGEMLVGNSSCLTLFSPQLFRSTAVGLKHVLDLMIKVYQRLKNSPQKCMQAVIPTELDDVLSKMLPRQHDPLFQNKYPAVQECTNPF